MPNKSASAKAFTCVKFVLLICSGENLARIMHAEMHYYMKAYTDASVSCTGAPYYCRFGSVYDFRDL